MLIFKISGSEILCAWPKFNQAPLSHLLRRLQKVLNTKDFLDPQHLTRTDTSMISSNSRPYPGWLRPVKFLIWKTQGYQKNFYHLFQTKLLTYTLSQHLTCLLLKSSLTNFCDFPHSWCSRPYLILPNSSFSPKIP